MIAVAKKKRHSRETVQDRIVDILFYLIVGMFMLICFYPVYFVIIASVSSSAAVNSGKMLLWPVGFHTLGYQFVFSDARSFDVDEQFNLSMRHFACEISNVRLATAYRKMHKAKKHGNSIFASAFSTASLRALPAQGFRRTDAPISHRNAVDVGRYGAAVRRALARGFAAHARGKARG